MLRFMTKERALVASMVNNILDGRNWCFSSSPDFSMTRLILGVLQGNLPSRSPYRSSKNRTGKDTCY